jgi:hypothetical protein
MRGCWESAPDAEVMSDPGRGASVQPFERRRLDFVPLDAPPDEPAVVAASQAVTPARPPAPDPLLGFWSDEA